MKQFKLLILTDHKGHSAENSLYAFVQAMRKHALCSQVDVASRGVPKNDSFFEEKQFSDIHVTTADETFSFDKEGHYFFQNLKKESTASYDLVWLRLPPPLSTSFLEFLDKKLANQFIINNPRSIYETGSKEFLLNFPDICPTMKICSSIDDIIEFKNQFPIVLKPFREYGGKGIIRIDGDKVWEEKELTNFDEFIEKVDDVAYLGVKFLKNVSKGDKRIIVINGRIMGASLRLPADNSWICNVAMGGSSNHAEVDEDERAIIAAIDPTLSKMGIVMYGVDTLVDDDGKRILSEINTSSIGGLPQIAKFRGQSLVDEAVDLIWQYFIQHSINIKNNDS
ncbi:MAG: glutathione synthase [Maribacter sp.]|jgi:glutathione synthase